MRVLFLLVAAVVSLALLQPASAQYSLLTVDTPLGGTAQPQSFQYYEINGGLPHPYLNLLVTVTTVSDNVQLYIQNAGYPTAVSYFAQSIRQSNPWAINLDASSIIAQWTTNKTWIIGVMGNNKEPQQTGASSFSIIATLEYNFPSGFPSAAPGTSLATYCGGLYANCGMVFGGTVLPTVSSTTNNLMLTSAAVNTTGAFFFANRQYLAGGFDVQFSFQIYGWPTSSTYCAPGGPYCQGGDGFAFVIHNDANSAPNTAGASNTVGGGYGGCLGYASCPEGGPMTGILGGLAVEFDVWNNREFYDIKTGVVSSFVNAVQYVDYRDNHVAVMMASSAGTGISSSHQTQLGGTPSVPSLADTNVHTARIKYFAPYLSVFVDDLRRPVLVVQLASLGTAVNSTGSAYIGFTASTGSVYQNHDITNFKFCKNVGCSP
eukprot:gnl/Hemi2/7733_TR2665_c0_g1_i1.p2 gnl/Hemi2/7733_TR2665_c0_g1~~gnl/Hemi2/7733_TR2665_c0_g1_i1.p2  ORF type:complete len:432 (-),score=143.73 gnl/Hemi2/7733_TR2665_c0_g1_i1:50-1345(-)